VGTDIYAFGGEDNNDTKQDTVMKYDTMTDAWSTLAPMTYASSKHSASICNGLVYIAGAGNEGEDFLCFDPASAEWRTLASTLSDINQCATFVLGVSLYAAGGIGHRSRVERYEMATDTLTAMPGMLEGRYWCGAVTLGSAGQAEEQDLFDSLIDKASRFYK
jgi:N-acetylneuraminic acid mutarotase